MANATMKRYLSLDALRGITVAFMCIVNNPGSWGCIFPPLRHAAWTGCTPTDLVYPFFIFCMGVAMAFSFSRFDGLDKAALIKIFKRGLGLFLVGLLLNMYPFFPLHPHDEAASFGQNWLYWLGHIRIFGVLQRIAVAYMLSAVIAMWLRKPGRILAAIGVLFVLYTGILLLFGSEPGAFTLEGNISRKIDIALVGENHVYHGYRLADGSRAPFDPEGLLGGLTAACTALLGYLIGGVIQRSSARHATDPSDNTSAPAYTVSRILVYGLASLALAEILSIWIPISKPLWSASYVLYAGGWAMLALGFLAFIIDVKGCVKPFEPFRAMGSNALVAFVASGLLAKTFPMIGFAPSDYFGANEYTSLLWALIFAFLIFCIQWPLYRKKIIIKL